MDDELLKKSFGKTLGRFGDSVNRPETVNVRLDVEGLRLTMQQAFDQHNGALVTMVQKELEKRLTDQSMALQIQQQVAEVVSEKVAQTIKNYFSWGDGGKLIDMVIADTFSRLNPKKIDDNNK